MQTPVYTDGATTQGDGTVIKPISSAIQSARAVMTSTDLLAATRITVVPAQGPGKVIIPIQVSIEYAFGTVGYTVPGGTAMDIFYGTGPDIFNIPASGFLDQATSEVYVAPPNPIDNAQFTRAQVDNIPITAVLSAPVTVGDGEVIYTVWYQVLDLA